MNELSGARARVALTGLTLAEYFRDEESQTCCSSSITSSGSTELAQGCRRCSAVFLRLWAISRAVTDMGALQERITTTRKGSIVCSGDLRPGRLDPAPATSFAHLDATTVLSRQIAELGIYPAVDPLDSTSRMLDRVVGEEHYNVARQVQAVLQQYKSLQDIIAILGMDKLSEEDKLTVSRARKIQHVSSRSPFHVAEVFTGSAGASWSRLKIRSRASRASSGGEYDDLPEAAFYMVGAIEEAVEKGKKMAAEAA